MSKTTAVATVNQERVAALRQKAGERSSETWPAVLKVNTLPLADDDTPLPLGKYTVTLEDKQLFLDTASVIILAKGTQFIRFNGDKYIGCTMIETGQVSSDSYKDSNGGFKLGKIKQEEGGTLTAEQKEFNKQIRFQLLVIALLDVSKATDGTGKKVFDSEEALWKPVLLKYVGKNAVTRQDELRKLKTKKELSFDFITNLTKPHKIANDKGKLWYGYHLERGDNVVFTDEIVDSIEAAQNMLENENLRIYRMHTIAQAKNLGEDGQEVVEDESYTDLELGD